MAPATRSISVKLGFGGGYIRPEDAEVLRISVAGDGSDSIYSVKTKIAEAAGGQMSAEDLLLSFGPCDRKLGRQYVKDPSVDEQSLKLSQYSILDWLERFPHWMLTVGLLPPTPPPPGAVGGLGGLGLDAWVAAHERKFECNTLAPPAVSVK